MANIAGFSDLLSQLNSFSGSTPASIPVPQPKEASTRTAPGADSLLLSRVPSNQHGASFDLEKPVAPELGETYRPAAGQMQRQLGMSFNLEFNLSIQRETVHQVSSGGGRGGSHLRALDATSQSYRSSMLSSRQDLGGSFVQARRFQADLFYSRTRELTTRMGSEQGERFDNTSQRVARTFEVSISLNASFLSQFVGQSERLSQEDAALFDQYLSQTDLRSGSGEMMKSFFDDVDRILADTEGFLQETLGDFFKDAVQSLGLTSEEAGALQGMVADEVTAFFDDLGQFLADARSVMAGFDGPPEIGDEQPEAQAALV